MKKLISIIAFALPLWGLSGSAQAQQAKVYFTKEITPESLVRIYDALGVKAHGQVAVKISTGESGGNNYLKPPLIRNLVEKVDGTIVECCTAYGGSRQDVKKHWATIHEHGFDSIFRVDIRYPSKTVHGLSTTLWATTSTNTTSASTLPISKDT